MNDRGACFQSTTSWSSPPFAITVAAPQQLTHCYRHTTTTLTANAATHHRHHHTHRTHSHRSNTPQARHHTPVAPTARRRTCTESCRPPPPASTVRFCTASHRSALPGRSSAAQRGSAPHPGLPLPAPPATTADSNPQARPLGGDGEKRVTCGCEIGSKDLTPEVNARQPGVDDPISNHATTNGGNTSRLTTGTVPTGTTPSCVAPSDRPFNYPLDSVPSAHTHLLDLVRGDDTAVAKDLSSKVHQIVRPPPRQVAARKGEQDQEQNKQQ